MVIEKDTVALEFSPITGLPDIAVGGLATSDGLISVGVSGKRSEVTIEIESPLDRDDREGLADTLSNILETNKTFAYASLSVADARGLARLLNQAVDARQRALAALTRTASC